MIVPICQMGGFLFVSTEDKRPFNRKGDGSQNPDFPYAIGMGDTKEMFEKLSPLITSDSVHYLNGVFDTRRSPMRQ